MPEQIDEERDLIRWQESGEQVAVRLPGDRVIRDATSARGRELGGGLREREQLRASQIVRDARVTLRGERGDRDLGEVVAIDERLDDGVRREHDLAGMDAIGEEALAEVL